jgi:hypothetical protein
VLTGEIEELFSGRIRGISVPPGQKTSPDAIFAVSPLKRKRKSMGDDNSRRGQPPLPGTAILRLSALPPLKANNASPSTSSQSARSSSPTSVLVPRPGVPRATLEESRLKARTVPPTFESPPTPQPPKPIKPASTVFTDEPLTIDLESPPSMHLESPPREPSQPDRIPQNNPNTPNKIPQPPTRRPSREPSSSDPHSAEPATELPRVQAHSQPALSVVVPTAIPPPSPHDNPESQKSTVESTNETDNTVPTLAAFLNEVSPHIPLGYLEKGLQVVGISSLTELRVVARRPEEFRARIPVLADLHEHSQYLWMKFKKGLAGLLEDLSEQPADSLVENDPVRRFIHSLGAGEYIDPEWLTGNLRAVGISTQKDLLVLSRNLEKYAEHIQFLQGFATFNKFGWLILQVGLESLPGYQRTPTFIQAQDHEACTEGHAYIKHFLDNIDTDKPLGYLADGFVKAGLIASFALLDVAEDVKFSVEAMPFLQGLASGDQLVWAMILVGLENLASNHSQGEPACSRPADVDSATPEGLRLR